MAISFLVKKKPDPPEPLDPRILIYLPLTVNLNDQVETLSPGSCYREGSIRTRVNPSTGLIQWMSADTPVFESAGLSYNPASTNLCPISEPTMGELVETSGGIFNGPAFNSFERSLGFPDDESSISAYFNHGDLSGSVGERRSFSVFVEMLDGLGPPVLNQTLESDSDFVMVIQSSTNSPIYWVEHIIGNVYRIKSYRILTDTEEEFYGVYRHSENRNRSFRITGYQFENSRACNAYIRTTGEPVSVVRDDYQWGIPNAFRDILNSSFGENPSAGTLIVQWIPGFTPPMRASEFMGIVSVRETVDPNQSILYQTASTHQFGSRDLSGWAGGTALTSFAAGQSVLLAVRYGYPLFSIVGMKVGTNLGSGWSFSPDAAHSEQWLVEEDEIMRIGVGHSMPFHIRNFHFYNETLSQEEIAILYP